MNPEYPEEQRQDPPRRRRRRKKTKWQIFKERYLPALILLGGLVLVIVIIVSLISAIFGGNNDETIPMQTPAANLEETGPDAADVLDPAALLAAQYDYDGAIALLSSFTGHDSRVQAALDRYREEQASLVTWGDNTKIPHISFQNLIVDASRAFDGDSASEDYASYNLTVEEFTGALTQMYNNGYVLVSMSDIADVNDEGKYEAKPIKLPAGKKPLVMSMLPANYPLSRAGDGFAMGLVLGTDGSITAEYIDTSATRLYGTYDFISILEGFIQQCPGFSYQGARAVIGVDNSGDLFGYDTEKADELETLKAVIATLKDTGYEFASFTYDGLRYGDSSAEAVSEDVQDWEETFTDLLGDVQILIYAGGSDLLEYAGDKYETLYDAGFRYFIGMDNDVEAWGQITENYVRQTRRTINGTRITKDKNKIDDLFDAGSIVSSERP